MIKKLTLICALSSVLFSCKKGEIKHDTAPVTSGGFFSQLSVAAYYSEMDLAVGENNDVYLAGTTKPFAAGESLDFSGQAVKAAGGSDAWIAKYDPSGKVIWIKTLGDAGTETGLSIAVDADRNIYTVCRFNDSTTIEGIKFKTRSVVKSSGSPNWDDLVLTKFDANGKHIWSKQISGAGYETLASIRVGTDGKIYVSGEFYESIFFDNLSYRQEGTGFYVACYSKEGKVEWAKPYGQGQTSTREGSIYSSNMKLLKNGEIVIVGSYEGRKEIGSTVLETKGDQDAFIVKLDRQGNVVWAKSFGSAGSENVRGLSIGEDDNIYIGGSFSGGFAKGPIVIDNYTLVTPTFASDAFLARFNSVGTLIWASQISGNGAEYIFDLVRHDRKLYVLGYFTDKLYLADSTLQRHGNVNAFLAEYSDSGKLTKVDTLGSLTATGRKIFVDKSDSKIIMGNFYNYYKFNNLLYPAKSQNDAFLVKF